MDTPRYEVVFVIDADRLIDSESYQRSYHCARSLVPGCYVVLWDHPEEPPRYDDRAEFRGPYASRQIAERALLYSNG